MGALEMTPVSQAARLTAHLGQIQACKQVIVPRLGTSSAYVETTSMHM